VENAYRYPLRHVFLPWCAREAIEQPSQLTRRAMERYQGELLANGGARGPLSPSTVHSYVRVVNQMLVWARDPTRVSRMECRMARSNCPNSARRSGTS
jgi:hypothetical protein